MSASNSCTSPSEQIPNLTLNLGDPMFDSVAGPGSVDNMTVALPLR